IQVRHGRLLIRVATRDAILLPAKLARAQRHRGIELLCRSTWCQPHTGAGHSSRRDHQGHQSSHTPADEHRWLSALGHKYSDVGSIVLHTGAGEFPWPTLPVTTQINGI